MRFRAAGLAVLALLLIASCSSPGPTAPSLTPTTPTATAGATTAPPSSGSAATPGESASEIPEPTTTNTLPPPPAPTAPAPSTAGDLDASSLPVPSGWRTIAREGGEEEGYLGNGTWIHGRDPRYAAFDVITMGCAAVTRDDYRDPTSALEGTYDRRGEPGIGLVLEFATAAEATAYFDLYIAQAQACRGDDAPVQINVLRRDGGLIDQRSYPDGDWTEVGKAAGRRVTLIILSDPGHEISSAQANSLLTAIR